MRGAGASLRRKANGCHDAGFTWFVWEIEGLRIAGVDVVETRECQLSEALCFLLRACVYVSDEHPEALA